MDVTHCFTAAYDSIRARKMLPQSFSFFSLCFTWGSLLRHISFLPSLLDFICWGMENSCAPSRLCQHCSFPFPPRTVLRRISSSNSLNNCNFTLLKFMVLTFLFASPVFLEITDSTRAWPLQPRLHPVLTS